MSAANTYFSNKIYPLFAFLSLILMILVSGYIFYQLWPKTAPNFSFIPTIKNSKTIYLLKSEDNVEYFFNKMKLSPKNYLTNLEKLKQKFEKIGYNVKYISNEKVSELKKGDILLIFDDYAISNKNFKRIKEFLKKGGNIVFNYHFGYFDKNRFVKSKRITKITSLKELKETITKTHPLFYIPKVLSPIGMSSQKTKRHDLVLYGNDTLPLFQSKSTPDAILTNWAITSTPEINSTPLPVNDAGIIWHGFYGNGKWFYFSFPQYVLIDMPINDFKFLFNNIFNYFQNHITIVPYPYIDQKSVIFISEDTEYKYENMIHFARLAKQKDINVTLFCVADLAMKHPKITREAATFPNVEIGSHSLTHSKILGASEEKVKKEILGSKEVLEKITGKQIYGFRPPREEIDKLMEKWLRKAGYIYVMEKIKPHLLPREDYKGLITIPRHGTDDYTYVIELNWDKKQILNKIIQETYMLTKMNALFTLSVHTHLLSYKTNLDVSAKYFDYLNKHPEISPMKGIDIAKRAIILKNLKIDTENFANKTVIKISNNSNYPIINGKFRVYHPDTVIKKIIPELIQTKVKIIKKTREYSDVEINKIPPKTTVILFVSF